MSYIMGQIELEHPELFALEFGKIAEFDFVYTPSSTNIKFGKNILAMKKGKIVLVGQVQSSS